MYYLKVKPPQAARPRGSPLPRIAEGAELVVLFVLPTREAIYMQFLQSISPLSREGLAVLATVVVSLIVLWLFGIFSRRRFIVLKKSEETELIAYQLRRIADALERFSSAQEPRPPAAVATERHVRESLFGR